ncbi:phage tail tape measure protein [Flavobacterium sp.]|uniref:phage tail tape measure protein n=1 Tax=Flavobacterium sp. TaxID=239 RepID=UPI002616DFCA|nr:phage tail tape measure protein [Flavobacterium sp.]
MARTITDEEIKLSIIINGNPAQKQLIDLEKATRKLTEENKALNIERRKLEAQGKKDTAEYKALTATIKANTKEIDNNKASMKELQNQIGLTGLTIAQLRDKANQLKMTLKNLIPDSADFKKYDDELRQVNTRLGELTNKAQASKFSLSSIADGFNKYAALGASVIATLTGVALSIQKIIDINGKLSDAQADVMKTTGMTKDEVDELTKSFGLLKTRTQRINLLGIAAVGGELNIAKDEILDFVKVMDKAGVSLGDSFQGGPEEVATKLGKIKTIYSQLKDASVETAFESVGSALNDLGAAGNATAENVADFVTRVGTMPEAFKPSIAVALGLGAAFEETGLNAEKSASNYSKVITIAANNIEGFARVMKKPVKEMENLMNTNTNEFFLQFSESIKDLKPVELAKVLDSLKLNDNEVKQVISAAGKNVDLFREKIDLANNSLIDATSLTNEFNIKNSTLGATLDKIKKTTSGWFSSEEFIKWLTSAVSWLAKLIGATDDTDGSAKRMRDRFMFLVKVIAIVVVSFISYNTAIRLTAIWTNALSTATTILTAIQNRSAVITGLLRSAQLLLASSYYAITGNTVRASAAMRLFNATASANPIGLILTAIIAVVAAMALFSKETTKASKIQKDLSDIQTEVAKSISKEKQSLESLVKIAQDKSLSDKVRTDAIKELNRISPEYLGNLTLENIRTMDAKKAIDLYVKSLEKKAEAQAISNKLDEIESELLDTKNKTSKDYNWWSDDVIDGVKKAVGAKVEVFKDRADIEKAAAEILGMQGKNIKRIIDKTTGEVTGYSDKRYQAMVNSLMSKKGLDQKEKEIRELNSRKNSLQEDQKKIIAENLKNGLNIDGTNLDDTTTVTGGDPKTPKKDPNSTQEEINRLRVENDALYNDILLKNRRQLEDDKIAAMQDGYQKELAIENLRYQREVDDLERQKVHTEEMAKMDEEISKAKQAGDMTKYNALIAIKNEWKKRNELIDDQINAIQEGKLKIHNTKLGIIYENAEKARIEKFQKQFERQKLLRETDFNNQLAALGDNEVAKAELKKAYDAKELELTEKHLQKLVNLYKANVILDNSFNLLTPAQKEKLQSDLDFALNALSKIKAAKNGEADRNDLKNAARSVFGQTDVLGFTANQWESTFNNLKSLENQLQAVNMVVTGLQNLWSTYSNFQTASENRNLKTFEVNSDKKKARLKRQLDAGYINQATYDKQIKRIDDEYEKRKLDIEYKQAKREKAQALFGAIVNTAKGITAAIPNPFLMSLAAIVGGLQIATIAKQPLPARGYEEGLYPVKREQDGKIFQSRFGGTTKSGLVTKPTYFLTGENGPEMIIDSRAYSQISPETKNALLRELRGIKGFENGLYNQSAQRFEVPASSPSSSGSSSDEALKMNALVMAEVLDVLKDLRDKPIKALVDKDDKRSMKNIKEGVDDYNDFRNKNKF